MKKTELRKDNTPIIQCSNTAIQNGARGRCLRTATFAPALATLSTSCLLNAACQGLDYASGTKIGEMDKWIFGFRHLWMRNGASSRCCPGRASLQKKFAGCRVEAIWSQSPVLPRTERAYETCLSAGSTAVLMRSHQCD